MTCYFSWILAISDERRGLPRAGMRPPLRGCGPIPRGGPRLRRSCRTKKCLKRAHVPSPDHWVRARPGQIQRGRDVVATRPKFCLKWQVRLTNLTCHRSWTLAIFDGRHGSRRRRPGRRASSAVPRAGMRPPLRGCGSIPRGGPRLRRSCRTKKCLKRAHVPSPDHWVRVRPGQIQRGRDVVATRPKFCLKWQVR